jgi:D-amino peptidase
MNILIMADMEGVSGIVTWDQVTGGKQQYEAGRILYTEEINAAIRGAKRAGATRIVAVDCHGAGGDWSFNSFLPELLDPDCEWVAHHPWSRYTEMFETGCDACLLVGMHARNNTPDGVLCHTISTVKWHNLWFNDVLVGEVGVNAALCGHYGVPILLVTGDEAVCRESRALLGDGLTTVAVKKGLTRYSARQIPPVRARKMIEDSAFRALDAFKAAGGRAETAAVKPYIPAQPTLITVEIDTIDKAADFKGLHCVTFIEPQKVVSTGADWLDAWDHIWHW